MRKALQAEQGKAEKLLQVGNLEKRIMEKENEVRELERKIWDMLEAEKMEIAETSDAHEREMAAIFADNQD